MSSRIYSLGHTIYKNEYAVKVCVLSWCKQTIYPDANAMRLPWNNQCGVLSNVWSATASSCRWGISGRGKTGTTHSDTLCCGAIRTEEPCALLEFEAGFEVNQS